MPFHFKSNTEKAVGMLTLSSIGESGSLFSTSVQCFCCLSFSKVLHMEYICLGVPVPQEKKKEEIKKRKITKKSINTCYSQICHYLDSEVPAGKVRTKIQDVCMPSQISLRLYESFKFYFIFISFCFILLYPRVDPSPSVTFLPGFVLSNVYFLFPYTPYFVFSKVGIFFRWL